LILLGAGFLIYKGLYNPWWDNFRYSASIGALIVALAFVIRQWEDESAREIDEVDSDEETGGDSPRKE
jgi:uncharacterized membrane protein YbhN (UPF0104 family)